MSLITTLEELSLNAWPSLQTLVYDGWILRFANGYTKRANSVNPVYASTMDIHQKINFCENLYGNKGLPVVFKMTSAVQPGDLDETLAARGYRQDSPTSVQTLDLDAAAFQLTPAAHLHESLTDKWLEHFCRMSTVSEAQRETLQRILLNLIPRHCFATLRAAGQVVACGLGVLQNNHIGLFDIVTDATHRKQGYGAELVKNILAWGRTNHAQTGYLQVMLNNLPALRLYAKIGFMEQYQYWYRIK